MNLFDHLPIIASLGFSTAVILLNLVLLRLLVHEIEFYRSSKWDFSKDSGRISWAYQGIADRAPFVPRGFIKLSVIIVWFIAACWLLWIVSWKFWLS
ncbi:MAG: hypothetical protein AAGC70_02975 [Pseudomonadota bacterium]